MDICNLAHSWRFWDRERLLPLAGIILLPYLWISCNPKGSSDIDYYALIQQDQSVSSSCGPTYTLILLNQTAQGSVVDKGWNYYKFQAPSENDAIFTLTPAESTSDVDLAVGFENQNIGQTIPTTPNCVDWDKCSTQPAGTPDIISGIHLTNNSYRCIGVYGRNCLTSGSCTFTLNLQWYVKP